MLELYLNRCPLADLVAVIDSATGEPHGLEVIDRTERLPVGSRHDAVLMQTASHLGGYFLKLSDGTPVFAPRKFLPGEHRMGDRLSVIVRKPERQGKRATVSLADPPSASDNASDADATLRKCLQDLVARHRPKRVHIEERDQQRLFSPEIRESLHFEISRGLSVDWNRFLARRKGRDLEIVVDETEAFAVIDVNSSSLHTGAFAVNQKAAELALREILLTKIRGVILIDFIDMEDGIREVFLEEIKHSGFNRKNEIKVHGFTSLGILEIARPKSERSLREMLRTNDLYSAIRCYYELCARCADRCATKEKLRLSLNEDIYKLYLDYGIINAFHLQVNFMIAPADSSYRFEMD